MLMTKIAAMIITVSHITIVQSLDCVVLIRWGHYLVVSVTMDCRVIGLIIQIIIATIEVI